MQHAEVVGVGGQRVRHVELGLPLGRQHRPRIDAAGLRPERAAGAAEDGAERALGDGRDLADEIELVVVEPAAHPGVELGQHVERMRREKALRLVARPRTSSSGSPA